MKAVLRSKPSPLVCNKKFVPVFVKVDITPTPPPFLKWSLQKSTLPYFGYLNVFASTMYKLKGCDHPRITRFISFSTVGEVGKCRLVPPMMYCWRNADWFLFQPHGRHMHGWHMHGRHMYTDVDCLLGNWIVDSQLDALLCLCASYQTSTYLHMENLKSLKLLYNSLW